MWWEKSEMAEEKITMRLGLPDLGGYFVYATGKGALVASADSIEALVDLCYEDWGNLPPLKVRALTDTEIKNILELQGDAMPARLFEVEKFRQLYEAKMKPISS